ncbi:unnamed protein product [Mycena citricolor]|uniref:Structure-specific endonuclease subunit SLX1 C-terminal domain-containing protein n=1 Tax=Mycena citricolor TaxID=2018698 RepID=A0AAD2HT74_9AGAR|nr:unnamed protein product [Mycena citricolor]
MQMIVHGFPSKLAALQFEWAWQHAHISRHLRDDAGQALLRRATSLMTQIRTVRMMLSMHPWSMWPLHIKLFTEAAFKGWKTVNEKGNPPPLPPGFTSCVELEGVDGRSGRVGSGRQEPLSVDDAQFTSAYLLKNTELLSTSNGHLTCSICKKEIEEYSTTPLQTTLCPTSGCSAVSHLHCLSQDFLSRETENTAMVPRGGQCHSCRTYVLWGDVIRGMYRRVAGGIVQELDDDALYLSDITEDGIPISKGKEKGKGKAASSKSLTPKRRRSKIQSDLEGSSEGEMFDLDVSSTSDSQPSSPSRRKRGRPPKAAAVGRAVVPVSPRKRGQPPKNPVTDESPRKRAKKALAAGFHTWAAQNDSDFFESDSLELPPAPLHLAAPEHSDDQADLSRAMSVVEISD